MERVEWTNQALAGLAPELLRIHQKIWAYAEPSSAEVQSAKLLCEVLRQKGFAVEENVCGRPTAFIATFGAGHPVVGYLGEYDALPGLSQQAGLPQHCPVSEGGYGHGCGHSALGTPGHSWFMTGMTGSSIGEKGLLCAGEIMGLAGIMVYNDPALLKGAQGERLERTGSEYHCPMYV